MQPIGERQVKQLREATERKLEGEPSEGTAEDFKKYTRRLVKDVELKGTIRTAVEGINLFHYIGLMMQISFRQSASEHFRR